jgi:undecaprenyl-diphosphatase
MLWISVVLLGLVEGLTEFLPVSSTGHLILTGHLLGFTGKRADCFEVFIQFGAILAVVFLFRERFLALWPFGKKTHLGSGPTSAQNGEKALGFAGWNGLMLLAAVTAPGLLFGKLLHHTIKEHLFNPMTVAIGLGVGGVFILVVEKWGPAPRKNQVESLSVRDALLIGLFQCLALWPGMSRASSTILGGMLLGFDRKTAAEFSFLAAVPLIAAAALYDLYKNLHYLQTSDIGIFAVGFVVALISAWAAIRFFMRYLARNTLVVFGVYRILVAGMAYLIFRQA